MNLILTSQEAERLASLAAKVALLRGEQEELALAKAQLPALDASLRSHRESVAQIPPSKLLAFGPEVRALAEELQRLQFISAELANARSLWSARVAELEPQIKREVQELHSLLLKKIEFSFRGADRLNAIALAEPAQGIGGPAERAEELLGMFRQLCEPEAQPASQPT